ncbi:hypothetical protein ACFQHO_33330 [Actinomadura yumaensis]|uniref:hypothetical protein n=1 Tax=Actinomadura yumaensis TaxID=111807 RepID=UPI00361E29A2
MTLSLSSPAGRHAPADRRLWRVRLAICWAAVAVCVPYLTLKAIWIAGGNVGLTGADRGEMHEGSVVAANVVTAAMDLAGAAVALAFTYRWGRRIPAWLVLVPIWVGTGLLAPFAVGLPLGLLVQAIAGGSPVPASGDGDALHTWVFAVVYGGFVLQAVLLLAAFTLHARTRWPELFELRTRDLPKGLTHPLQVLFANGSAAVAVLSGAVQIAWAVTGGRLGGDAAFETAAQRTFVFVGGTLAFVAAAGILALVHRWGRGSLRGRSPPPGPAPARCSPGACSAPEARASERRSTRSPPSPDC